ncbi:MAG: glycosyltransferase family 2 protein [Catenulispora sp.]|nr:glycosyltransferase family 2 protein [Catenulispora sp.]
MHDDHGLVSLISAISLALSILFPLYVLAIITPFLTRKFGHPGQADQYQWHFFVPCRDEEAVIGGTLGYLRKTLPSAHVWVIDDDSDDATADIVKRHAENDPMVHLVQRRRPNARLGKGEALNAAYRKLSAWLPLGTDRKQVMVCVVDADGRPAANCLEAVSGRRFFGNPEVGAVQIEVRMVNRSVWENEPGRSRARNFYSRQLVRMQDLEFRAPIAAIQHARKYSQSVSLGGNGQFARLSALDALRQEYSRPWTGRLLEDFELGMHMLLTGHVNTYCTDTYVDQEALFSTRRFITQRTRWAQGVMQCFKYLRAAWSSDKISNLGLLEIGYYLFQPWLQLFGAVLYPLPFVLLAITSVRDPHAAHVFLASGGWIPLAVMLGLGILQFAIWGPLYRWKCEPSSSWRQAIGWGFAYVLYLLFLYIVSWRAVWRMVRRKGGWAKTRRNAEVITSGPVAQEA